MTIGQHAPGTGHQLVDRIAALTYGIPVERIAEICQVSLKTAQRWKRSGSIPESRRQALILALDGDLGAITDTWSGFCLADGELVTPEGERIRPGEIRAIGYRKQQLEALKKALSEPCQWKLFK